MKATVAMIMTHKDDNYMDDDDISVNEVLQNSDILPSPSNLEQLINWPLRKIMKQSCYLGFVTTEIACHYDIS